MWHSVKGGRRGRGGHSRAESSARSWKDAQGLPLRRNLHDKEATFSNESTQAVAAATFSNESTQVVAVEPVQESTVVAQGGEGNISTDIVPAIKKRGRGPARGTQFDRLRKVGKIPLVIKDGHRGPSCEHASIFTGRVTWIVKVYADMRHASWSCVPEEEKQELIDRVRADFVLDWTKDNHKEMVITYLSDKYNHYHYELHKVYLKYASHEEALRGGTEMVDKVVWQSQCERWASGTFKEKSQRNSTNRSKLKVKHTGGRKSFIRILEEKRETAPNMVAFYKETHWSRLKGKFINATTENNYNLMVEKLKEKDPEEDVDEVAAAVFKDVLGFRSGYAQGMGHMVIPDPSPSMKKSKAFVRLAEENERNKTCAEMYKSKLDSLMSDMAGLRREFSECEKGINLRMSELEGNTESHRETQQDA